MGILESTELHITNRCNLSCTHCFSKHYRDQSDMDLECFRIILGKLEHLGNQFYLLSGGGEPTLHPLFWQIVVELVQRQIRFALITNGTQIASWSSFDIRLLLDNAEWLRVSLDAPSADTFQRIKGSDFFDPILESIQRLHDTPSRKAKVGVQFVAKSDVLSELTDWLASSTCPLQTDYVFIKAPHFNFVTDLQQNLVSRLVSNSSCTVIPDAYYQTRFRTGACFAPRHMGAVDAKGVFWGCCKLVGSSPFRLADLLKESSGSLLELIGSNLQVSRKSAKCDKCLGIPPYPEINSFAILLEGKKDYVVAVDLDGVLTLDADDVHTNYHRSRPNNRVIESLRNMAARGATIVVYTARPEDDRNVTIRWLEDHDVPHDRVIFDKVRANVYLDDRNLEYKNGWENRLNDMFDANTLLKGRSENEKGKSD